MAAPLSQDEIDALLNSADDFGDDDDAGALDMPADDEPESKGGTKHIGLPEIQPFHFGYNYNSPVLKSENYIYNPEEEVKEDSSGFTSVVWSLLNYTKGRSKKTG